MKTLLCLFIVSSFLLIVGCQPAAVSVENPTTETAGSISQITTVPVEKITQTSSSEPDNDNQGVSTPGETLSQDASAKKLIQLSKESLVMKFKISIDDIHLSSADAMIWPDASLGCPQTGMSYAQVMTPGFLILLEAMGQAFSFHTDDTERVILCEIRPPDEIFLPP